MNWLRDNILKILIILGVAVVAVVILAIVFKPNNNSVESASKYAELETKLQNAAIKYVSQHKKLLPTTTENITKIDLKTLQSNNYIGKIVAIDDSSIKCDGYVEVTKVYEDKQDYRYTPYISCGKYYVTKAIADYIIDVETENGTVERTTDSGLYKIGDEYIFRGEKVNNFIQLGNHKYRIVKIASDRTLELISTTITPAGYVWDDRYNIDRKDVTGINNFNKSRLYDSLINLYEQNGTEQSAAYFSKTEKNHIVDHDFCIGKRSLNDGNPYSDAECKETISLKVGLLTAGEAAKASLDVNCKTIFDESCINYNYFFPNGKQKSYATLTAVADSSYKYYKIRPSGVISVVTSSETQLYPVIYINSKSIYLSGSGTTNDPYVVR